MIGNCYTFANINVYVATYFKYSNYPNINKTDSYFLLPICILMITTFAGFGGVIERFYGPRM